MRTVTFSDVEQSFRERVDSDEANASSSCHGTRSTTTTTSTTGDFYSCVSGDSDEFFDVLTDDEDPSVAAAAASNSNGDVNEAKSESDVILELFRAVDDLMEGGGGEQRKALRVLRQREDDLGQNSEFLWRLCKAIYLSAVASSASANNNLMSEDAAGENAKRALVEEAVEYGRRAVQCNDLSSEAHKW